mmetsp:Transcript_20332/g.46678  ORF Transcript_20332/g.46678 Transcript_20332/m.46678 type:complete len:261 (+) Transcript_20332:52-834(+)
MSTNSSTEADPPVCLASRSKTSAGCRPRRGSGRDAYGSVESSGATTALSFTAPGLRMAASAASGMSSRSGAKPRVSLFTPSPATGGSGGSSAGAEGGGDICSSAGSVAGITNAGGLCSPSTCAGTCVAASSGSIPGSISASPAPRGIHAELAFRSSSCAIARKASSAAPCELLCASCSSGASSSMRCLKVCCNSSICSSTCLGRIAVDKLSIKASKKACAKGFTTIVMKRSKVAVVIQSIVAPLPTFARNMATKKVQKAT